MKLCCARRPVDMISATAARTLVEVVMGSEAVLGGLLPAVLGPVTLSPCCMFGSSLLGGGATVVDDSLGRSILAPNLFLYVRILCGILVLLYVRIRGILVLLYVRICGILVLLYVRICGILVLLYVHIRGILA